MNTITIDGRIVVISVNKETGETRIIFPDVHLDPFNPNDPFGVIVSPAVTYAAIMEIIKFLLGQNPPS